MPFKKGQSGNPGGRPKDEANIKRLAQLKGRESIEKLAFWMRSDNPKASVSAATALLDRGYGKATQMVESGEQLTDAIKNHWVRFGDGRTSE